MSEVVSLGLNKRFNKLDMFPVVAMNDEEEQEKRDRLGFPASMTSYEFHKTCCDVAKMLVLEMINNFPTTKSLIDKRLCAETFFKCKLLIPSESQQECFFINSLISNDGYIQTSTEKISFKQAFDSLQMLGGVTGQYLRALIKDLDWIGRACRR